MNIGIMISGNGSNMLNIVKACHEKKVQAKVNDKKQKGTKVVSEKDW